MASGLHDPSTPHEPFECALPGRYVTAAVARSGLAERQQVPPFAYYDELAGHLVAELDQVPAAKRRRHLTDLLVAEAVNRRLQWEEAAARLEGGLISLMIKILRRALRKLAHVPQRT